MIENLNLNIWIPALITLLGFISYFFGKIISETSPGVEEKAHNYISGFVFILVHIILPLALIYHLQDWLLIKLNLWFGIGFFIILSFLMKYLDIKKNVFIVNKGQAYADFEKESLERTNLILSNIGIPAENKFIVGLFRKAFLEKPSKVFLLLLSFLEVFIITNLIYSTNIIFQIIFLILLISSMSNVAILVAGSSIIYNNVIVEDKKGKKYHGKIIKYGKEFISIRDKRKVYNFIRENVNYILTEEKLPFIKEKTGDKK